MQKKFNYESNWDLSFELETSAFTGINQDVILHQDYITGRYKNWKLHAGAQNTPKILGGLSSSNGNIIMSINARAIPGFILSTNGYIPITKNAKKYEDLAIPWRVLFKPSKKYNWSSFASERIKIPIQFV